MEKALHDLLAAEEIRNKLAIYCRAADRNDIELGASIFTKDSQLNYGEHFSSGTGRDFFEWCIPTHIQYFASTCHRISNIYIKVDGDTACSETYVHSFNVYKKELNPNGQQMADDARGRYIDQWRFENGEWLIAKRMFLQECSCQTPVINFSGCWGARDQTDPSYKILK